MATVAAIDAFKSELAVDFDLIEIDDESIGVILDLGLSDAKTRLATWRAITGKVLTLTDVSESGSSRQLGVIFDRARQMVDFWQARVDAEDKVSGTTREHGASLRAVRV